MFRVAIYLASALSDRKTGAEPSDSVQNRGKGHDKDAKDNRDGMLQRRQTLTLV